MAWMASVWFSSTGNEFSATNSWFTQPHMQWILRTLSPGVKRSKHEADLTAWSRLLLEKVTVLQLVKAFPAFYGSWTFITVRDLKGFTALMLRTQVFWFQMIRSDLQTSQSLNPSRWRRYVRSKHRSSMTLLLRRRSQKTWNLYLVHKSKMNPRHALAPCLRSSLI